MTSDTEKKIAIKTESVLYSLIIATVLLLAYNQMTLFNMENSIAGLGPKMDQLQTAALSRQTVTAQQPVAAKPQFSDTQVQAMVGKIIPTGVPAIYGKELSVSYDDPVTAINQLGKFDKTLQLSGDKLQRYINVTNKISCEYCCGVTAITRKDGTAACDCAHSGAMRGLAKYMLTNHDSEITDEQLLQELGKWKALFFPQQVIQKALLLEAAGQNADILSATVNYVATPASTGAGVSGLPGQVGGC